MYSPIHTVYCGDVINFKTYSKNFRNKRRLPNDPDNWVIFKDVHEPIIDRATFDRGQEIKSKTKRRAPKNNDGEKHLLSDYLYCGDCNKKLWYHTNTINKEIHFFSCSNCAKDYRGTCPTVYYRFVGYIEIPELAKHRHNVKADTRQGVSVEYVPQIATA